ncbi:MAG: beta-N-acetylhexosaminidase, partial [Muribaculaceae bacterium]|nr:beta-N-acetylhexosaminidase [Muribaculaceae bacterium]
APVTPRPVKMEAQWGSPFIIDNNTTYYIADNADSVTNARISAAMHAVRPGIRRSESKTSNQIRLSISENDNIPSEGYTLTVNRNDVTIEASYGAGLFYGIQTFSQLAASDTLAQVTIWDAPRFEYRGIMLDVSRHFQPKEFLMKQMDAMAALKFNTLHLHLSDAAGWRLQIDSYPKLTEIAAWRAGKTWKEWNSTGNRRYLHRDDPNAYGGYYTKDDIRELVQYAADRYINIIPEIEMPSHSEEVIAAYPYLGCTKVPYTTPDLCPGSESTFKFIENVLDEVIEIFPSELIHIGGDEAPMNHWHNCPACMELMINESLSSVDELQSYMLQRIESYIQSKGRQIIGWDEIVRGNLSPTATVHAWRGSNFGLEAARQGNAVVMSPGKLCYFDAYQDAPDSQPEAIGGYLPIELVYSYDPAPDTLGVDICKNIRGVEGTLFTEYIPTAEHAEYMLYPRAIALSEVAWTPQELRSYDDFRPRAVRYADSLRARGYNTFVLENEIGCRPGSNDTLRHLAYGASVKYNIGWWRYPASGNTTLTDGLRGGWAHNDQKWQAFYNCGRGEFDVTIDLGAENPVTYIGAEFMQRCSLDIWFPTEITISTSDSPDGPFTELTKLTYEEIQDDQTRYETFGWNGSITTRYIRYRATNNHGIIFTDEVIVN